MRKFSIAFLLSLVFSVSAHAAEYIGIGPSSSAGTEISYEHRGSPDLGFRVERLQLDSGSPMVSGHAVKYLPMDANGALFAGAGVSSIRGNPGASLTIGAQSEANRVFVRFAVVHSDVKGGTKVDAAVFTVGAVF